MKLIDALPKEKYIAALKHSTTEGFQKKKAIAIKRFKDMYGDPRVNRDVNPVIWFGGGKDSVCISILCAEAGIYADHLSMNNGADVKGHAFLFQEWRDFYEKTYKNKASHNVFKSAERYPILIKKYLDWGKSYGIQGLSFWDWKNLKPSIGWESYAKFQIPEIEKRPGGIFFWGNRRGEGQEKAFQIARLGLFQTISGDVEDEITYYRGLPIGDWLDIDVWATLIEKDAPISVVYSYHEIPQKKGNRAFPRTIWYCSPDTLCSQMFKWLAKYSPAQLKELCELFPEIPERLK